MESFLLMNSSMLDMVLRNGPCNCYAINNYKFLHVRSDLVTFILFFGWMGGWLLVQGCFLIWLLLSTIPTIK